MGLKPALALGDAQEEGPGLRGGKTPEKRHLRRPFRSTIAPLKANRTTPCSSLLVTEREKEVNEGHLNPYDDHPILYPCTSFHSNRIGAYVAILVGEFDGDSLNSVSVPLNDSK